MKIELFDKSEEIYKALPKKYAEIILNSIIAQSITNGSLIRESNNFISIEELQKIAEKLKFKVEVKKDSFEKKTYKSDEKIYLNKKEQIFENKMSAFEGFD